jgi:PH domain
VSNAQSADEVEFWRNPEKSGWMYSQGDVIKTWRRRWFVLKQGFLFRFADQNVDHASKPRGIVDLTNVQDVSDGREATSKANSIKLATATGQVQLLLPSRSVPSAPCSMPRRACATLTVCQSC